MALQRNEKTLCSFDYLKLPSSLTEEELQECRDAAEEYTDKRTKLGIFCSQQELADAFNRPFGREGAQITQYFSFLRFVLLNNLVMSFWALAGWIPHVRTIIPKLQRAGRWGGGSSFDEATDILFLSSYQPSSDAAWVSLLVLGTLTMISSGPLYYYLVVHRPPLAEGRGYKVASTDASGGDDGDVHSDDRTPHYAEYVGRPGARRLRRVLSYVAFAAVCGVPVGINYALLYVANHRSLQTQYAGAAGSGAGWDGTALAVAVSAASSVSAVLFESVAGVMTELEKPLSWSEYRAHRLGKLAAFRVIGAASLFAVRYLADAPFFTCVAGRLGWQMLIFMALDLTINNAVEWLSAFVPGFMAWYAGRSARQAKDRAPVELTDDYFEVIYRQYLLMLSFPVFPPVCFFCLLANLVEYVMDKYRFLRFASKPDGRFTGGQALLAALLTASSLAGLVTFPSGPVFFAPPVGPVLCWPCDAYSLEPVARTGAACGAGFEPPGCGTAADGTAIESGDVRARIDRLLAAPSAADPGYLAAAAWLDANDGSLFRSRRCACRPCILAMACACDMPTPQKLGAGLTAGTNGSAKAAAVAIGRLPRANFSYPGWKASAQSLGAYCGGNPINPQCWECPEAATGSLVDPVAMADKWPRLPFCDRCLWGSCFCTRQCPNPFGGSDGGG